jgi:GNAT superfamily N-acetyltransferase
MRIRAGDAADLPAIAAIYDGIITWMVARGNTAQWGTESWSDNPGRAERVAAMIESEQLWMAELDGEPVGVLITSPTPQPHAEPAGEPELYVRLLLTSRRHTGQKIGSQLLVKARSEAEERGVSLMRVDCFAGGTGDLVRYYERNGFTRTSTFTVGDWPGQVLEQRW